MKLRHDQVSQLRQLAQAFPVGVAHGDVVGKSVCAELIAIGLAGRDEHTYYATKKGRCWIAESEGGGSKYTEYGL